jgi:flagellar hook-length control protein FliK
MPGPAPTPEFTTLAPPPVVAGTPASVGVATSFPDLLAGVIGGLVPQASQTDLAISDPSAAERGDPTAVLITPARPSHQSFGCVRSPNLLVPQDDQSSGASQPSSILVEGGEDGQLSLSALAVANDTPNPPNASPVEARPSPGTPGRPKAGNAPSRAHDATSECAIAPTATSGFTSSAIPVALPPLSQTAQAGSMRSVAENNGMLPEGVGAKAYPRRAVRLVTASALATAKDPGPARGSTAGPVRAEIGEPGAQISVVAPEAITSRTLAGPLAQPARPEPTASPAGPPASPHLSARSPAVQVAPVMVSFASGGPGTHRLVLHLDPPELGRLEIRMTRSQEVGACVDGPWSARAFA